MSTASTTAWLDREDRHCAEMIRRYGCFIQYVGGCRPDGCGHPPTGNAAPFAYSVGFFGMGHPELLIVGADPGTSAAVINDLCARVRAGRDLVAGELVTFEHWAHRITIEQVSNPGEIVFAANRHYQRPAEHSVPVLQLTYDDAWGRFPWDEGYANDPSVQPRPGTFRA